jgi:MFS family permease
LINSPAEADMNLLRKRDLLLTLKYATIEACFSVPMLNLTLTQFAFAVGFAVTALGWKAAAIGWLTAIPHLCNAAQPPITFLLRKCFSQYQIMVLGFALNALPWGFVSFMPWMGDHKHWAFALIVTISTLANSICAVAWAASMSDVVPLHIRGRYFGRRNMTFGFWTLVVVLAAGYLAEYYGDSLQVFGIIFAVAAMLRMFGLFFLTRMKFPPQILEARQEKDSITEYFSVLRSKDYLWLVLFIGFWGFALNIGMPFYSVYVLRQLPMSMGDLTLLTTLSTFGGLVALPTWGILADRFGNKPVLLTCAIGWCVVALASWALAGPQRYLHLYLMYFLVGITTAGFQLCQFNLMVKMIPTRSKAPYISVFLAVTSLLTAAGPILGGKILMLIPHEFGTFLGQPILRFHVVFLGSLVLCLLTTHLLQQMREPAERPLRELVRVMRNMREFNPALGLMSVVQVLFTPRRLTKFAEESLRTLRRQTADLTEVGEELFGHGWRRLKQPFSREDDKDKR